MSREPRSSTGTPRACSAMNDGGLPPRHAEVGSGLGPQPVGDDAALEAEAGEVRRKSRRVEGCARAQPQEDQATGLGGAADLPAGDALQQVHGGLGPVGRGEARDVGDGNGQSGAHGQAEAGKRLQLDATRAQRSLVESALDAAAERDEADVVDRLRPGRRTHAAPPELRRSSSSSSSLRLMPMVSSSSWCRCIQTVWYESIRGDASQASSPSSSLASASVSFAR